MPHTTGLIGAIVGSTIGVAGGLFGTWLSIRNLPPGTQRRFMMKISMLCWVGVLGFTVSFLLMPASWKWLMWTVYGPSLLLFIRYVNRSLDTLRTQDDVGKVRSTCGQ